MHLLLFPILQIGTTDAHTPSPSVFCKLFFKLNGISNRTTQHTSQIPCRAVHSSTATADMDPCGEGYYSLLGDPTCTACPAGYRCPQTDDDPIACDPGYYRYRQRNG